MVVHRLIPPRLKAVSRQFSGRPGRYCRYAAIYSVAVFNPVAHPSKSNTYNVKLLVYDILVRALRPERKERHLPPCGRGTVWILPVKLVEVICQTVTLAICCAVNGT